MTTPPALKSPVNKPRSAPCHRWTLLRARRVVGALIVPGALALAVAAAAPAAAHAVLDRADPDDGSRVTGALSEVVLEFSDPVSAPDVLVEDPGGRDVSEGLPEPVSEEGTSIRQAVGPLTRQGTYTVRFRVTSADGHSVEGAFPFEYAGPVDDPDRHDTTPGAGDENRDPLTIVTRLWPVALFLSVIAIVSGVSWRLLRRFPKQEPDA